MCSLGCQPAADQQANSVSSSSSPGRAARSIKREPSLGKQQVDRSADSLWTLGVVTVSQCVFYLSARVLHLFSDMSIAHGLLNGDISLINFEWVDKELGE